MKNSVSILTISFSLLLCSCEESFSPKTDFQQRYALNCIIRGDTTFQTATILKSYNIDGYNSYSDTSNPFVSAKEIKIWKNNERVFFFKDTTLHNLPVSRDNFDGRIYYLSDFEPGEKDSLKIRAVLENDLILWAWTRMPERIEWNNAKIDNIIPVSGSEIFNLSWMGNNYHSWYIPRLTIYYDLKGNQSPLKEGIPVPITFEEIDGIKIPIYSKPIRSTNLVYKLENLNYAMHNISKDEKDKSKFIVYAAVFELLVLDNNLSIYYSNSKGYLDDYSIRVDQQDFSNVQGGFGIFGSYLKQIKKISLRRDYIETFGYTPGN